MQFIGIRVPTASACSASKRVFLRFVWELSCTSGFFERLEDSVDKKNNSMLIPM